MELLGRDSHQSDNESDSVDPHGGCSDDDGDGNAVVDDDSTIYGEDDMDTSNHSKEGKSNDNASSPLRPPLPLQGSSSTSVGTPSVQGSSSISASIRHPAHQPHYQTGGVGQGLIPQTPPATQPQSYPLSPPSPPGRRFAGGLGQQQQPQTSATDQISTGDGSHSLQDDRQNVMTPPRRLSSNSSSTDSATNGVAVVSDGPPAMGIHRRPTLTASEESQSSAAVAATTTPVRQGPQNEANIGSTSTPGSGADGPQRQQLIAPPAPRPRHRQSHHQQQQSAFNASVANGSSTRSSEGRFVPHVVTISLDTTPYVEMIPIDDNNDNRHKEMMSRNLTQHQERRGAAQAQDNDTGVPQPKHRRHHRRSKIQAHLRPKLYIPGRLQASASQGNGGDPSNGNILDPALLLSSAGLGGNGAGDGATSSMNRRRPRLGQLLEACPLDGTKASAVTCVKFSPSCDYLLIGYGVRDPVVTAQHPDQKQHTVHPPYHPVTALYRCRGGMEHISTMLSSDDDVNIARFHPLSGSGFVYGTKQGRVRVLGPRPWNYYNM